MNRGKPLEAGDYFTFRVGLCSSPINEMLNELSDFLLDLAAQLEESGMPGKAGDCSIWAERLREPTEAECALMLAERGFVITPYGETGQVNVETLRKVVAVEKATRDRHRREKLTKPRVDSL